MMDGISRSQEVNTQDTDQNGPGFIHLHAHSAYSLLEGSMQPEYLQRLAIADDQPALAITDRNNLFGALEFSSKAVAQGLQPIMGCKLAVDFSCLSDCLTDNEKKDEIGQSRVGQTEGVHYPFIVLLAMNEAGFSNLTKLVSRAHLLTKIHDLPHVSFGELESLSNGLIVLSGGREGPLNMAIAQNGSEKGLNVARDQVAALFRVFGDRFYVELQRHKGDAPDIEIGLLELAYGMNIPLVATNQPYFARADDHEAHAALICIAGGNVIAQDNRPRVAVDHYFKSRAEMKTLFSDLPEALANSVEIARRCIYRALARKPILPNFMDKNSQDNTSCSEFEELEKQSVIGLEKRLSTRGIASGFKREDYEKRLEFELNIIRQMGFPGYFLIVADFIRWAKEQDIPVGPGRGSGAGSVVAWSLNITDLDPMRFGLLFERFLNPERLSMPDFDIDFCQERREEVIHYVQEKYGRDKVAQIITFGTLQARAVLRDVGRVLQMPYGQVDRLCKLVPANPTNPVTLAQAVDNEPRLMEARREEEVVEKLFNIAMRLEGLYRHASTHAAGIVIGDRKLEELVPLYRDPRSDMPVSQYNMKWVESAGLVKFDFLGLKTLTILKQTVKFIALRGKRIDLDNVSLDDAKTFEMLSRGETVGVFQLESAGMRKALIGMKPDRFEDIIALVALYRPGPMDNIPTYNARKNGQEEPEYYHPKIKDILAETYGVIIYQEQVLQIARVLSGYTLGEADFLRKAMGKKIKKEMDDQRARFVAGAVERDIDRSQANDIFDVLAKFAGYGFNKAHATAYALISYQTAYLKCHYPVEFLAASMQMDMSNTDKLSVFYQDARHHGIEVTPPSLQTSQTGFSVKNQKIVYALAAIKGVGEGAVKQIVSERENNGKFVSVTDFFSRVNSRQLNRRTVENLICAGAFDCFGERRETLLAGLDRLLGHANKAVQDRECGQSDMFGGDGATEIDLPQSEVWQTGEKMQREYQSTGFYLSAHPLDEYRGALSGLRAQLFREFEKSVRAGAEVGRLAGVITIRQERKTRTGKRMGVITVSDPSGQYEAVIFEEALNRYDDLLELGQRVILLVGAEMKPEGLSMRILGVYSLEKEVNWKQRDLRVFMRDGEPAEAIASIIQKTKDNVGDGKVSFVLVQDNGAQEVEVLLKDRIQVTQRIASALKAVPGVLDVELV